MAPLLWLNQFLMFSAMCVMLSVLNYLIVLLSKNKNAFPITKAKMENDNKPILSFGSNLKTLYSLLIEYLQF